MINNLSSGLGDIELSDAVIERIVALDRSNPGGAEATALAYVNSVTAPIRLASDDAQSQADAGIDAARKISSRLRAVSVQLRGLSVLPGPLADRAIATRGPGIAERMHQVVGDLVVQVEALGQVAGDSAAKALRSAVSGGALLQGGLARLEPDSAARHALSEGAQACTDLTGTLQAMSSRATELHTVLSTALRSLDTSAKTLDETVGVTRESADARDQKRLLSAADRKARLARLRIGLDRIVLDLTAPATGKAGDR